MRASLLRVATVVVTGVLTSAVSVWSGQIGCIPNRGGDSFSYIDDATFAVTTSAIPLNAPFGVARDTDSNKVFFGEQGDPVGMTIPPSIAVVNTGTNELSARVMLTSAPTGLAVSKNGASLYVATMAGELKIYTATGSPSLTATIPVGVRPYGVGVLPNRTKAYVAHTAGIDIVNLSNNAVTTIPSLQEVTGVVTRPDSSGAYVSAGVYIGRVWLISAATNAITASITVGARPTGLAIKPDGTRMYSANEADDTVSVINTASNSVVTTIAGFHQPYGVSVNPAGTKLFVVNQCGSAFCGGGAGQVTVVDTATNTVIANVSVGLEPLALGEFFKH